MYVRGPITPCGLAARDAVFIRVRTPNMTGTLRHPTGWLISNFLIVLTGDVIQSWMTIKRTEISAQHEFLKPMYLCVHGGIVLKYLNVHQKC